MAGGDGLEPPTLSCKKEPEPFQAISSKNILVDKCPPVH
jgi:hypothetical protein